MMLSPFALRLLLIGIYVTLCCVSPSIGQGPGGYLNTGPPINPNERPLRFKLFSPDTRFHIRNIGAAAPWVLGNENLIGDKWIRTSDKDRRKYGGGYTGNPLSQGLGLFGLPKRTPGLTGLGYTQKGYDDGSGPDDSYIGPGDLHAINGYTKESSLLQLDPHHVRKGIYEDYPAYRTAY